MLVSEMTVEVRDPNFSKVGQITAEDLVGATFVSRFNNIGSWEIRLPYGHYLGELLRLPGYGLIVTGPSDEIILSGPTLSANLEQTIDNLRGDWLIVGADDSIILGERLAYPTPTTDDLDLQFQANDSRAGAAESVIKAYLSANLGSIAPLARRISYLEIEADLGRGLAVNASARFTKLQELFYNLAQTGAIGYKITQSGSGVKFSVYQPTDRSSLIRMDLENQKLSKSEYAYANPTITRAIVAGQGEAEQRRFIEVATTDSAAAESDWGRRIEIFKDRRDSEDDAELIQAGLELLVDEGKTIVEMSVTPSDEINMKYGQDWFLGDKVMVVANEIEASAVVTEVGISIQSDGVRIGATVGTPVALNFEAKLLAKQQNNDERISNLERNEALSGIPIRGQVSRQTSGTITIASAGAYVSTGLTATFDTSVAVGMGLGTTDTFAIKKTSPGKRFIRVYGSMDARAGNNKTLGVKLALNGSPINQSECRAFTGSGGEEAKLVTSWIIEMDEGDEVALFAANISDTVDIDLRRARIVASGV